MSARGKRGGSTRAPLTGSPRKGFVVFVPAGSVNDAPAYDVGITRNITINLKLPGLTVLSSLYSEGSSATDGDGEIAGIDSSIIILLRRVVGDRPCEVG